MAAPKRKKVKVGGTPAPALSQEEREQLLAEELDPGSGQSLPMNETAGDTPRRPDRERKLFDILARG